MYKLDKKLKNKLSSQKHTPNSCYGLWRTWNIVYWSVSFVTKEHSKTIREITLIACFLKKVKYLTVLFLKHKVMILWMLPWYIYIYMWNKFKPLEDWNYILYTYNILETHLTSSTKQLLDLTNIIQRETTLLTSISFTDSGLVSLHTSYPLSRAWVIYSANMCFDFPNKSKYLNFFLYIKKYGVCIQQTLTNI